MFNHTPDGKPCAYGLTFWVGMATAIVVVLYIRHRQIAESDPAPAKPDGGEDK